MSPRGKILFVEDGGSVWSLLCQPEDGGLDRVVFGWGQLANFYEGTAGRSFFDDYNFGSRKDTLR